MGLVPSNDHCGRRRCSALALHRLSAAMGYPCPGIIRAIKRGYPKKGALRVEDLSQVILSTTE